MLNKAMHKTRLTQNNFTSWAHTIRPWPCVLHIYSSSPPLKLSSSSSIRVKFQGQKHGLYKTWVAFGLHVVRGVLCLAFPSFFYLFFFLMHADYMGSRALCTVQETLCIVQETLCTVQWVPCTVHGIHNHFIQEKTLKMGPMTLFTYLKIILQQYFQFLAK